MVCGALGLWETLWGNYALEVFDDDFSNGVELYTYRHCCCAKAVVAAAESVLTTERITN